MAGKQQNNNMQNKGGQVSSDSKQPNPNPTPRQTQPQADIDETTAREDEYNKFNKNTVNPRPQATPGK